MFIQFQRRKLSRIHCDSIISIYGSMLLNIKLVGCIYLYLNFFQDYKILQDLLIDSYLSRKSIVARRIRPATMEIF